MAEDKKEEKKKNGKNNIKSDTNSEKNISSKKKKTKKRVKKDENQDLKREIDTKEIDTKISGKTTKRKKKNKKEKDIIDNNNFEKVKKEKDNIDTKKIGDLDDIDKLGKKDDIVIKSKDEKRIVLDAVGKVKVDDVETEEQLDLLQQKTNEKLKEIEDIDKASLETEDDEIEEKEKFEENVQKKVIEKLGKSHKRKVAIITILLFVIAISLVSTIFSVIYMGKDIIAPNIYLGSINIGGLTKEEAKEKIAKRYEEKSNKEIKAVLKDYEQIIKPEMVEFNADINKLVDLAYMEGRNGNIIENNYTIISRYFNKKNLEISYNINEELMQKLLEEIAGKIPEKVKEPSYNVDGTKLFVYPGMKGNEVNKLSLREKIVSIMQDIDKISDEDLKITIPVDIKQPNNIDIEKIHNEIYEKPENATYNEQTKELKLDKDGLDFAISMDEVKNMLKEKKEEYIIPLRKVKAEITYDKLGKDIFPDLLRNISNKL
jgi:vancomycin B-type resistance protein vanW